MERKIDIIKNDEGNSIAVVNSIRFKGKRSINWNEVEGYLKQYIGTVTESNETVYIGSDLPDEYTGSNYTAKLKGALAKAKANAAQGIPEMIQIAGNGRVQENLAKKHAYNAKFEWHRYDSRFALPIFDDKGTILRYNVFRAELVIRHAADKKLYLYDIINIKKKRAPRLSTKAVRLKTHFSFRII